MSSVARSRFLLVAFCLVLFAPALLSRDLWKPDEPRYAQVSREMVETGEWIVPHLNGETYAHKPPLVFWFGGLVRLVGLGPDGGRIASMLAAIGTALLTMALARRWFSPITAGLAPVILLTTWEFGWMARNGGLDSPLTFLTTVAVYAYVRGGALLPLLYVAAGLSVLVKGPVGLLFVVLGVVSIRLAKVPVDARASRHATWGIPLTLAVIAAWVVPACIHGGEAYTQELLFKQNVGRTVSSWSHQRPFYYYLYNLPMMIMPWIIVAPVAIAAVWRRRRKDRPGYAMLLWVVSAFVLFSIISGKRTRYLLPVFPAIALVLARGIEISYLATVDPARSLWMRRSVIALACIGMLGAFVLALAAVFGGLTLDAVAEKQPIVAAELRWVWDGAWQWLLLLGVGIAGTLAFRAFGAARRREAQRATVILLLASSLSWIAADLLLLPIINPLKSPREVTRTIDEQFPVGGEREVRIYPRAHHAAYSIYSDRLTWTVEMDPVAAAAFLRGGPNRAIFVSQRDLTRGLRDQGGARLSDQLSPDWPIFVVGRVGSAVMVLVCNFEIESLPRMSHKFRK